MTNEQKLDKLKRLQFALKAYESSLKSAVRTGERNFNTRPLEASRKQVEKARVDHDWSMMDVNNKEHEAHACAVELGIASPEPHRYGEKTIKPDGWHEYKILFREPIC